MPNTFALRNWKRFALTATAVLIFVLASLSEAPALAQDAPNSSASLELPGGIGNPEKWTSPEGLTSTIQVMLLLTVISLAPAILLMTTSFVRIVVVLGLLRQALGTQQLPPSQVITSIAMFMTLLIMTPVWTETYEQGIRPYTQREISLSDAWTAGTLPIRRFMADQIRRTENDEDVYLFLSYLRDEPVDSAGNRPDYVYYGAKEGQREVPLRALVPAFMLSELKTAFLIGFQIYLPFVILDIVVASVTISMGMMMLPPVLVSLPFKLLLFVLVDGWHLVVDMLMQSFQLWT
ncbi:MAG: flagellar type III secretion system pore protein FliP [Planctomycetales bacterium]|nr:flagellar type III secretion system pore protein FliP [Planctomycetales bacterium]